MQIRFSEPIDPATITAASVVLIAEGGSNGTETEIPARRAMGEGDTVTVLDPGNMRDERTGAEAIGPSGGTVTFPPDPRYQALVPEGAFADTTVVRLTPAEQDEFPDTADETMEFVDGVVLDVGGAAVQQQLDITVPAPPDATAEDQWLAARVVNFRGREELTMVDTAFWDAARGVVQTDPVAAFPGLRAGGLYTVLRPRGCVGYVTGWVSIGEHLQDAYVTGGMRLPFPVEKIGPERFAVPVPCDRPVRLELRTLADAVVDFLSLSTAPPKGEFVFSASRLSDDTTAPRVIDGGLSVPSGSQNVGHDTQISVPFSEALLDGGQLDRSVKVLCRIGGAQVQLRGTWSQSADGRRIFFVPLPDQPLHGLPLGVDCEVQVSVGVDGPFDLSNNAFDGDFLSTFSTFTPIQLGHLGGGVLNALDVDRLDWFGASPRRQYVAVAEGDSAAVTDSSGGIAYIDVTDPSAPQLQVLDATAGVDWSVRFVKAELLKDAKDKEYHGPYVMSTHGPGARGAWHSSVRFGVWKMTDLSGFPQELKTVFTRRVNLSEQALAVLEHMPIGVSQTELASIEDITNSLGIPLAVAANGVEAAYVANAPFIGLQMIRVQGFERTRMVGTLELPRDRVDATLSDFIRGVTTLKNWVIGAGPGGLVVADAGLNRSDALGPVGENAVAVGSVSASWVLGVADWPVDRDRNGRIGGNEYFDLVLRPCLTIDIGPALCVNQFDTGTGRFDRGGPLNTVIALPPDSSPRDAVVDPVRRLLYVADGTRGVTIVDLQDPQGRLDDSPADGVDDRVLYSLRLGTGGGAAAARAIAFGVSEQGRTVGYVGAGEDGLFLVDLGAARMDVHLEGLPRGQKFKGDNRIRIDEVRYFNTKPWTVYEVAAALPGRLAERLGDDLVVRLRTLDHNGAPWPVPADTDLAPGEVAIMLRRVPGTNRYHLNPDGARKGKRTRKLLVSNLPLSEIATLEQGCPGADCTVLYGGLGGRIALDALVDMDLEGKTNEVTVEKVDVVVLGIDGLRQDVFYPASEEQVRERQGVNYYVDPMSLPAFAPLLGGPLYQRDTHELRLPGVSAIFPSITLASWASIFTGAAPRDTGITGNEFFARSKIRDLSQQPNKPVITLSEGVWGRTLPETNNLTPVALLAEGGERADAQKADQNRPQLMWAKTLFSDLKDLASSWPELGERFPQGADRCAGKPRRGLSVMTFNHYARGTSCWLTMTAKQSLGITARGALDRIPAENARLYLDNHLREHFRVGGGAVGGQTIPPSRLSGGRNRRPFPALFALYMAGLDHAAHEEGHGAGGQNYTDYVRQTVDPQMLGFVSKLQELEEYYNKIVLLTADHGHSRISQDAEHYPCAQTLGSEILGVPVPGGKTNWLKAMGDPDMRPLETTQNNNLHIWELAKIIAAGNEMQDVFRPVLLVPKELKGRDLLKPRYGRWKNVANDLRDATLVAAMNGPMAHLYLRPQGKPWTTHPGARELGIVAEVLRLFLGNGQVYPGPNGAPIVDGNLNIFGLYAHKKLRGLVKLERLEGDVSGGAADAILVRPDPNGDYFVFNGLKASSTRQHIEMDLLSVGKALTEPDFVQAARRLDDLNDPERSGDIIILMRDRTDDPPERRFTTGVACRGWHASMSRSDSYVPFILSYPGGNRRELEAVRDQICHPPGQSTQVCTQNRVLPEFVKAILAKEYAP